MKKIEELCIKVLEYTKKHQMKISEETFYLICGKQTEAVLAELKQQKVGTFVNGYKSIWSVNQDSLELALTRYKSQTKEARDIKWKWIVGIAIPIIGILLSIII